MLAREIGAYDLRANIAGGHIDMHTLPAVFPVRIGEEALQHFGVKLALAFKIAVETAAGQASIGHNSIHGDIVESELVEELARASHDLFPNFIAVTGWVRHSSFRIYVLDHILRPWFNRWHDKTEIAGWPGRRRGSRPGAS